MSEEQKKLLEQQLWNIANILRGKISANQFQDYILGFIFYKYLSEKMEKYANTVLKPDNLIYNELDETTDLGQQYLAAIKEASVEAIGFYLKPSELFSSLAKKGNAKIEDEENEEQSQSIFILEDLANVLSSIEKSTMGTESEDDFDGLFYDLDLNSTKLGRTVKDRNAVIVKIIGSLNEIDFDLDNTEGDILGDAYEYLIAQFAAGAGQKAGEFYTPQQVSTILSKIVTTRKSKLKSVYDPTCGSGSLLLRVAKEVDEVSYFYGQEQNRTTYNLARMNMILHNVSYHKFDIKHEDTLERPQHTHLKFEAIVANPPFSAKWSANPLFSNDDRFSQYGKLAPSSKADFAFIQHMVHQLDDNGIMACIAPHGVLYRGASEGHIRKYLIEDRNYIDAVIGLPVNLFYGTNIPTCILILKKCRENPENILFIDASNGFEKIKSQNYLRDEDVDTIIKTYQNRDVIDRYSNTALLDEIKDNNFNINITRYVNTFTEAVNIDINEISKQLNENEETYLINDKNLKKHCEDLNIPFPKGNNTPLLKLFKKSVIQQIFQQNIRFKDKNGNNYRDWENKQLGDIANFFKGKGLSKNDISEDGSYKCIHYGELFTKYNELIKNVISKTDIYEKPFLSKSNDVLMPTSDVTPNGLATASCILEDGVILGGDVLIIRQENIVLNGLFLSYYIAQFREKVMKLVSGSTVYHLYGSDMKKLDVLIPCIEEQKKITDLLSLIDQKLDLITI